MARTIYELTDETRIVLSHNPQGIAEEMDKHPSFIYDFLEMRRTDIFAKFKPLYSASVRAGAPVCHWDNWFDASKARNGQLKRGATTVECLKDKLNAHNDTILKLYESLEDGHLSEIEIRSIQSLIQKEIEELTRLNLTLSFQLGTKIGTGGR